MAAKNHSKAAPSTPPALAIEAEQIDTMREAMLIGLASFGEVVRVRSAVELERVCRREVPNELMPLHPTGSAETIGKFAEALRSIEMISSAIGQNREIIHG